MRQARPLAEPNPGFWRQLHLYHQLNCTTDLTAQRAYQCWKNMQTIEQSKQAGVVPDTDSLQFAEDVTPDTVRLSPRKSKSPASAEQTKDSTVYRCRRCRQQLASSKFVQSHGPEIPRSCAHVFLDQPLAWMRPEMEQGKLDGRLECPKCRSQVGRYAWQGSKCSCGKWMLPGISLGISKIDAVKVKL